MDLRLAFDAVTAVADLMLAAPPESGLLDTNEGLETSVLLSLFLDKRSAEDDPLPTTELDRRGWWADQFGLEADKIGSRLWLLERSKLTPQTVERARRYAEDALRWMLTDGVAKSIEVTAAPFSNTGRIDLRIRILRATGVEERYAYVWEGLDAA